MPRDAETDRRGGGSSDPHQEPQDGPSFADHSPYQDKGQGINASSSPATSWDEVHPTKPTDNMEEMISHLTQEERNHILHTIQSRMMDVSHSEDMQSKMSTIVNPNDVDDEDQ